MAMNSDELKRRRKALELTQEEFGKHDLIRRSRMWVNRWEKGAEIPHWVESALEQIEDRAKLLALLKLHNKEMEKLPWKT